MSLDNIKTSIAALSSMIDSESSTYDKLILDLQTKVKELSAAGAAVRSGKIAKTRPVISGKDISNVTGLFFVEGSEPGTAKGSTRYDKLDAMFKYADEESSGAFNLYQVFLHPDEMKDGKIIDMVKAYNIELVADTMDALCFKSQFFRNNLTGWADYVEMGYNKGIRIFSFDDLNTIFTKYGVNMNDLKTFVKAAKDRVPDVLFSGSFSAGITNADEYPVDIHRYEGYRQGESVNLITTWATKHPEKWILDLECYKEGTRWTTNAELKAMCKLAMLSPNIVGTVAYTFFDATSDLRTNQSLFDALVARNAIYWRNR